MGTNTGIGIGIGIPFKNNALGGDNIYFPPELKARMIGVWDNYGKKNTDADRNIIKNKIPNAGGDLEILNAAYEGMSGCNGYPVVFGANETWENLSSVYGYTSDVTSTTIHITKVKNAGTGLLFTYVKKDGALTNIREIPAFKVTVKGLEGNSKFGYRYLATEDATVETLVYLGNGTHELSKSFTPTEALLDLTRNAWVGIFITPMVEDEVVFDCDITIEVLPEYEGAFVTDGVNDMIISQKTIAEMGITDEVTIVSMIHQITLNSTYGNGFTNYIENLDKSTYVRNNIYKAGKTGIYGYSVSLINRTGSNINNILGDKNDYGFEVVNRQNTLNASKLSIIGRATGFNEISSIAHYWTFAVLGKATADEINLIIAKYNLDRTLRPDILCNIERQGITNDNHADFNDKLIDYSGNGRDIQMYNLAWKGGSGVAAKQYETFKDWTSTSSSTSIITEIDEFTRIIESTTNGYWVSMIRRNSDFDKVHEPVNIILYQDDILLVHECKYKVGENVQTKALYDFLDSGTHTIELYTLDRFTDIPENAEIMSLGEWLNPRDGNGSIKYSLIPSCKGGILLDGITDFGKVIGMPIYKDYTLIVDRQIITNDASGRIVASKSESAGDVTKQGAFIFEYLSTNAISTWSYYKNNSLVANSDSNRNISYQSKYSYNGKSIEIGEGKDSDKLWIGTIRDNDERFANIAIYSLMSFPYSMSKFLIERQLKKHKLGTLYPNMVEFRPVIKQDNRIKSIKYYIDGKTANIGQYYPIGTGLDIAVEIVQPYMVKSLKVNGVNTIPNVDYKGFNARLDSKSPQKITMDIQVDSSLVQWNPIITSTAELTTAPTFIIRGTSTLLKPGDWIPKNSKIWVIVTMNNLVDELRQFSLNGTFIHIPSSSYNPDTGKYGFPFVIDNESPQNINLTIDEYIRYEDIVQPYPILLGLRDENDNEVSWGDKLRVGSTATFTRGLKDSDLLYGMYKIDSIWLNNENMIVVADGRPLGIEKKMEFRAAKEWFFDNNEPKCILSPSRLRIPNSSYKLLGYIPDISGHGNHGVIHNSAYAEGSGVNEDGSYQFDGVNDFVTIPILSHGGKQVFMKTNWLKSPTLLYDQRASGSFAILTTNEDDATNLRIAYQGRNQDGKTYIDGIENNYIETYSLKGIIHNITVTNPSAGSGVVPVIGANTGKSNSFAKMSLYDFMLFDNISTDDKIKELNEYVGIEAKVELPPYYWDTYGKTNLDEDKNYTANLGTVKDVIEVSQPAIFAENWYDGNPEPVLSSPIINQTDYSIEVKANKMDNNFTMMLDVECDTPLPAFKAKFSMVGTAISVNLKYYINGGSKIIDVFKSGSSTEPVILDIPASERSFIYGTNTDNYPNILIEVLPADNDTRYGLTNTNFAYDKMSGYGGYSLGRFDKSWSSSSSNNTSVIVVSRNPYDITLKKLGGNSDWEFNNTELKVISNPVSVKFKSNKNIRVTCDYHYYPVGGNSEGTPLGITSKDLIANKDAIITISPISQENIDKYNIDVNRGYYLIYFQLSSTLAVNEEVIIEMLPLYPNGLVYDGVTDYSENANIPVLTDYTYILKRQILKGIANSAVMYKGNITVNQGGAFICNYCEPSDTNLFTDFSFGGLLRSNDIDKPIIYGTKTSVNGDSITPGENIDTVGINVGKWVNYLPMVLYKLILYPKTIPLLQINFLKNLMERDEIIDLNNPIFKK